MNENGQKANVKFYVRFFMSESFYIFYKTVAIGTALISNIIYNVSIR